MIDFPWWEDKGFFHVCHPICGCLVNYPVSLDYYVIFETPCFYNSLLTFSSTPVCFVLCLTDMKLNGPANFVNLTEWIVPCILRRYLP